MRLNAAAIASLAVAYLLVSAALVLVIKVLPDWRLAMGPTRTTDAIVTKAERVFATHAWHNQVTFESPRLGPPAAPVALHTVEVDDAAFAAARARHHLPIRYLISDPSVCGLNSNADLVEDLVVLGADLLLAGVVLVLRVRLKRRAQRPA